MNGMDLYYKWVGMLNGIQDDVCYPAAPPWLELSTSRQHAWNLLAIWIEDQQISMQEMYEGFRR